MSYLTEEKLAILGAAGAIGSNMVQAALTMKLTPQMVMYDPYEKGLQGAAEEIYHCGFRGARLSWTADSREALRASYEHLVWLRDEVISLGVLPPLEDWSELNPNLD